MANRTQCHTHPKIKDAPKRRRESSHTRALSKPNPSTNSSDLSPNQTIKNESNETSQREINASNRLSTSSQAVYDSRPPTSSGPPMTPQMTPSSSVMNTPLQSLPQSSHSQQSRPQSRHQLVQNQLQQQLHQQIQLQMQQNAQHADTIVVLDGMQGNMI